MSYAAGTSRGAYVIDAAAGVYGDALFPFIWLTQSATRGRRDADDDFKFCQVRRTVCLVLSALFHTTTFTYAAAVFATAWAAMASRPIFRQAGRT